MTCERCGTKQKIGAPFCPHCGAPAPAVKKVDPHRLRIHDFFSILVCVGAVLLVYFGVIAIRGYRSPEKAAENFVQALGTLDAETYLNCYPDFVIDDLMDNYGATDKSSLLLVVRKKLSAYDRTVVQVRETEADHTYYDPYELEFVREYLKDEFHLTNAQVERITNLCLVTVTYREDGETGSINIDCYKYDGRWYIFDLYLLG